MPMISRRQFIHAGCAAGAATLITPAPSIVDKAEAFWHGSSVLPGPSGKSLINAGGIQSGFGSDFMFKNLFKTAQFTQAGAVGFLDANGYPTSNGFSSLNCLLNFPSTYTGRFRITWTGAAARMQFQGPAITVYNGGANVVGLGGNTGVSLNNPTFFGTIGGVGYVEFDFSMAVTGAVTDPLGSGQVQLTVPRTASLPSPAMVYVQSVSGVTGASGWFPYTIVDSTHILLTGSTFGGTYTSGGSCTLAPTQFNVAFLTTDNPSGFTNLILCRSSAPYANDLSLVQGGIAVNQFNDDYLSLQTSLGCSVIRLMDQAGSNGSTISRNTYIPQSSYISFNSYYFLPNLLVSGSAISGTNAYTASSYPDMPGSWTDGETFQGVVTNAVASLAVTGASSGTGGVIRLQMASTSTLTTGQQIYCSGYNSTINIGSNGIGVWTITVVDSTHIELTTGQAGIPSVFTTAWTSGGLIFSATINVGSRGAKLLIPSGRMSIAYTLAAAQATTFVYDALQGCVTVFSSGMSYAMSLELRVALCNKLNAHYWHNLSHLYNLSEVANDMTYIKSNLNSNLNCYVEVSNELWNQGQVNGQWSLNRGTCFGWNPFNWSYNGLLMRTFYGQATTTWGARGGLIRVGATSAQAITVANSEKYIWEGFELNGTNFPAYAAAGYVNYDVSLANGGNGQPQDFEDAFSYATYANGVMLTESGASGSYSSLDVSQMTAAADNWAGTGGGTQANALAWADNDARQGTTKTIAVSSVSGGNTFNTATAHGFTTSTFGAFSVAVGGSFYSTGATQTVAYWVVNPTTTTFQLSLSQNGSPISGITGGSGVQFGILGQQTLLYFISFLYPQFAAGAVKYAVAKMIINYEGGIAPLTVSQAQCTSLGIASTYGGQTGSGTRITGGTIWNLMQAWKLDVTFQATVLKQYNDVAAAYPGKTIPAWYTFGQCLGGLLPTDQYSIIQTDIYGLAQIQASEPVYFASFPAIQYFNTH